MFPQNNYRELVLEGSQEVRAAIHAVRALPGHEAIDDEPTKALRGALRTGDEVCEIGSNYASLVLISIKEMAFTKRKRIAAIPFIGTNILRSYRSLEDNMITGYNMDIPEAVSMKQSIDRTLTIVSRMQLFKRSKRRR